MVYFRERKSPLERFKAFESFKILKVSNGTHFSIEFKILTTKIKQMQSKKIASMSSKRPEIQSLPKTNRRGSNLKKCN